MKKSIRKIIVIGLIFVLAIGAGYHITHFRGDKEAVVLENPTYFQRNDRIAVKVQGEVKVPGEYSVPSGIPLHDVLYYAGGVTEDADLSGFDFDIVVFENCTVFVPCKSGQTENDDEPNLPIDINKADAEDFINLPGIGDKLASQIINYRNLHGDFNTAEELMNVKGVGESKFEAIKDMITVGGTYK